SSRKPLLWRANKCYSLPPERCSRREQGVTIQLFAPHLLPTSGTGAPQQITTRGGDFLRPYPSYGHVPYSTVFPPNEKKPPPIGECWVEPRGIAPLSDVTARCAP